MIGLYSTIFQEVLCDIPEKQKELLYAIAKEDKAEQILSSEFIKKYSFTSASSVEAVTNKLLERGRN